MPAGANAYLVIKRDDGFGDVFPLAPGQRYTLGRATTNSIVLKDDKCSREHAEVSHAGGRWHLRDLGSTNGTRVNGQRVRRAALLPNDQLTIASFKFRVHFGPEPAAPVRPDEHTQHLDAKDVAHLLRKPPVPVSDESSGEIPVIPVQANALPDVYPDDKKQ